MARAVAVGRAAAMLLGPPSLFFSERPVDITKPLEDQRAMLGEDVVLRCELSREGTPVRWLKDGKAIRKSRKYELLIEGTRAMLVIHAASLKDSGEYTRVRRSLPKAQPASEWKVTPMRDPGTAPVASLSRQEWRGAQQGRGLLRSLRFCGWARRTTCDGSDFLS